MAKKAETVETVETMDAYSKHSIMISKRFAHRRDALSFLLEDDGMYTLDEVETILDDYMKGQVK